MLQLHELDELRNQAYDNQLILKTRMMAYHDKRIIEKHLHTGDKVLLYNSRFKLFPGKLKTKWEGPYTIINVYSHGAVDIKNEKIGVMFKVNGQRLKPFFEGIPTKVESQVVEVPPTNQ